MKFSLRPFRDRPVRFLVALVVGGGIVAVALAGYKLSRQTPEQQRQAAILRQTVELPAIDRVEILRLGEAQETPGTNDFVIRPAIGYAGYAPILESQTATGSTAQELASLWRSRQFGRYGALCHEPPYALRFVRGAKLIFETSLCWECFNFTISYGPNEDGWLGFEDPDEELLGRLKQLLPLPAKSP